MTLPVCGEKVIPELPLPIPRAGIPKGTAGAVFLLISRHPRAARASQPPTPIASSWSGRLGSKGVAADKQKVEGEVEVERRGVVSCRGSG